MMPQTEIQELIDRWWDYEFPGDFEHRVDPYSSQIMYSLIREEKPKVCVEVGTWKGGSTCLIHEALMKNDGPFIHIASELADDLRRATAENVLKKTGQTPEMLGDVTTLKYKIPKEIDFLFVDTDHDLDTTKWIVKNLFPRIKKGGLMIMHDWAAKEVDGVIKTKDGSWPENDYLVKLYDNNKLGLEKVFWTYDFGSQELAVFRKT